MKYDALYDRQLTRSLLVGQGMGAHEFIKSRQELGLPIDFSVLGRPVVANAWSGRPAEERLAEVIPLTPQIGHVAVEAEVIQAA